MPVQVDLNAVPVHVAQLLIAVQFVFNGFYAL